MKKEVLNNVNLSLKAKGLYAILSMRKSKKSSIEELYKMSKNGRESTRSARKELVKNGYIIVEKIKKDDRFLGSRWVLAENKEESK